MKTQSLWIIAVAAVLCGCAEKEPVFVYHEPLISPGGEFSTLPPTVQNTVRAEAGMAEMINVIKHNHGGAVVYEIRFRNPVEYPPLYVAADGSVLNSDFDVVVGASEDTIAASTGSGTSGVKLDDLPPTVVDTIRHQAPTAEVDFINRLTSEGDIFYNVRFKDPAHHPKLLIRDDGRLVQ